jgi:hypothetical protein
MVADDWWRPGWIALPTGLVAAGLAEGRLGQGGEKNRKEKKRGWAGWENGPRGLEGKESLFLLKTLLQMVTYFQSESNLKFEQFYLQYKPNSTQSMQKKCRWLENVTNKYI